VIETVLWVIFLVLAGAVVLLIAFTVQQVSSGRPPQPPATRHSRQRVTGRSLRGWQASVNREIRRAGRENRRGR
jgi:hypothetical protein